jgi:hypothetical protein
MPPTNQRAANDSALCIDGACPETDRAHIDWGRFLLVHGTPEVDTPSSRSEAEQHCALLKLTGLLRIP